MRDLYEHPAIENKWRDRWEREGTHRVDLDGARRPFYNLMMFPYPSAEGLHVGNVFAFVGADIQGRFRRALGFDVFEPMGFDAFGMHSENVALRTGAHPRDLVRRNITRFREEQLKRIGNMFDWTHEVDTTDPGYYRWTQWIFLQLYKAGLAYRADAEVTWCPCCRTVLADEQAEGGTCERCAAPVHRRTLTQWFFRITAYAGRLLDNLPGIDWSTVTKEAQRRWIGRSEGAHVVFPMRGAGGSLTVFTTRPDTLWGATYLAVAPNHPLAASLGAAEAAHGAFTGVHGVNPATGAALPVWTADYVTMGHGTGAVMGVPAHDARDYAFAERFSLPVVPVVHPAGAPAATLPFEEDGVLRDSGPFTGQDSASARRGICAWLAGRSAGGPATAYHLHDWCISRQRYWGPPIPIVYCGACGTVPVPESDLPVVLPDVRDIMPDGSGLSPLARHGEFLRVPCPVCGRPATRETDVSDNFLDSAWYFLRYPSAHSTDLPFDPERTRRWLPVDMYVGGNEHAVLHLMYTRFLTMALHDLGHLGFEEPFKRFRAHGLIIKEGAKMSKSKGNVVSPDRYLERYGADVFRTYLMFFGDFQLGGDFRDDNIAGIERFIHRAWWYVTTHELAPGPLEDAALRRLVHQKTEKVTRDIERLHYNTAIATLMELLQGLAGAATHHRAYVEVFLKLLGPFAPFIAHELWERIGGEGMLCDQPWPETVEVEKDGEVEMVIQVNGKIRDRVAMPRDCTEEQVTAAALSRDPVKRHVGPGGIARAVFVPNKLLNIVTAGRRT